MSDEIDQAQEVNELHQRISLAAARARAHPVPPENFDGEHCVYCGEKVETVRLALELFSCVACQAFIEKYHKTP